jgi:monoterpene epsilon-lactone hydrolase
MLPLLPLLTTKQLKNVLSIRAKVILFLIKKAYATFQHKNPSISTMRIGFERVMASMPNFCKFKEEQIEIASVFCLKITSTESKTNNKNLVLYLHGGAYAMGSPQTHARMCGALAQKTGYEIIIPKYALAPERPFPQALHDILRVYKELIERYPTKTIILAGDSAGGGLALSLKLFLRDHKVVQPKLTLLLSPWLDLTGNSDKAKKNEASDIYISIENIKKFGLLYAGDNIQDPYASPIFSELDNLGDIYIQVGEHEILRADSEYMLELTKNTDGTHVTLDVVPGMFHVFQQAIGLFPEANTALDRASSWLKVKLL